MAVIALSAGCGRPAPEGAQSASPDIDPAASEPSMAGIQVVGQSTVVPPASTTAPQAVDTTAAPAMGEATVHVVQAGDTLSVIAEQYGVPVDAISAANGITDVNSIRPGQELTIPAPGG